MSFETTGLFKIVGYCQRYMSASLISSLFSLILSFFFPQSRFGVAIRQPCYINQCHRLNCHSSAHHRWAISRSADRLKVVIFRLSEVQNLRMHTGLSSQTCSAAAGCQHIKNTITAAGENVKLKETYNLACLSTQTQVHCQYLASVVLS